MRMELVIRFDYGAIVPWVRRATAALRAVAGPDALVPAHAGADRGEDLTTVAEFTVRAGERVPFVLDVVSVARDRAADDRRRGGARTTPTRSGASGRPLPLRRATGATR